jgi:hypothetical protein
MTDAASMPHYEERFVAFVDILGWTKFVEASESGAGMPLGRLLRELAKLRGTSATNAAGEASLCITQISDCVVVSSSLSPIGLSAIIAHCWFASLNLLASGIMCRGYLTKGQIFHTADQFIGTAYQRAVGNEKRVQVFKGRPDETGTPFIEIDAEVCTYGDSHRGNFQLQRSIELMTRRDGEVAAIFPFQFFQHSYTIGGGLPLDTQKEKGRNNEVRQSIQQCIERLNSNADPADSRVLRKVEHYVRFLRDRLTLCDKVEEDLTLWDTPIWQLRERKFKRPT